MRTKLLTSIAFLIFANRGWAQQKAVSPFTGWWINTQYKYLKNRSQSEDLLFHIPNGLYMLIL